MAQASEPPSRLVLVVDDDPEVRDLVSEVLAGAGFQTLTATDGTEGLALAQQHRPAVIILDVMMRVMDGHTALTRLRDLDSTRDIPVIILTGQDARLSHILSLGLGAVAHVTKPFSPRALIAIIQDVLGDP